MKFKEVQNVLIYAHDGHLDLFFFYGALLCNVLGPLPVTDTGMVWSPTTSLGHPLGCTFHQSALIMPKTHCKLQADSKTSWVGEPRHPQPWACIPIAFPFQAHSSRWIPLLEECKGQKSNFFFGCYCFLFVLHLDPLLFVKNGKEFWTTGLFPE